MKLDNNYSINFYKIVLVVMREVWHKICYCSHHYEFQESCILKILYQEFRIYTTSDICCKAVYLIHDNNMMCVPPLAWL